MASLKSYLSIISINLNGLNSPIKRHRVADWIKRHDPSICCLQETHLEPKDAFRLRVRGWSTIFHANGPQKKAGVAILISDMILMMPFLFKVFVSVVTFSSVSLLGPFYLYRTPFISPVGLVSWLWNWLMTGDSGRSLFLHQFWMTALLDKKILGCMFFSQ